MKTLFVVILALSTPSLFAQELSKDKFNLMQKTSLDTAEELSEIAFKLNELSEKLKAVTKDCPCPDGECTCGPDCKCPNCPIHSKPKGQKCTFEGKPNSLGRHAKLISSVGCLPCSKLEKGLCDAGLCENIELFKFASLEEITGYESVPHVHLMENGQTVLRLDSSACSVERIQKWLDGEEKPVSRVQQGGYVRPSYSAPSYSCGPNGCGPTQSFRSYPSFSRPSYSAPFYGGSCGPGGCGPRMSFGAFGSCGPGGCR